MKTILESAELKTQHNTDEKQLYSVEEAAALIL